MDSLYQLLSCRDPFATLQKSFPPTCGPAIRVLFRRHQPPRLEGTGPATAFRIMLAQTSLDIRSYPDVMLPSRNAFKHVQKILQKLEPLTGIEPVTFRYGRSTIRCSLKIWSR